MTLIASISGIRGTIGGENGENLTPIDIVNYTAAFGTWLGTKSGSNRVVIGKDARPSGPMVEQLVIGTLMSLGFEVVNLGLSTTPTVELAVVDYDAAGGIILTASHNPKEWNALKLLNSKGEFVTRKEGGEILELRKKGIFTFNKVDRMGSVVEDNDYFHHHIEKIMALPLVDSYGISKSGFRIVVDGVNSSGGVYVPMLLRALGIKTIIKVNCEPTGEFAHDPEPLEKNLIDTCDYVREQGADLGIVVDPDVDRLVFIDENGKLFGEEYTLVAIADYILQNRLGAVVSNLSSSRALTDVAARYGCPHKQSAVGEVNVTDKMRRCDAVIGGEGNGGIILPDLHYGRDALVGIALFLTHLAKSKMKVSELRATYPDYYMSKQKAELIAGIDVDAILEEIETEFEHEETDTTDGLKIDFADSWVHLRKSNTEPIIRIYTEAKSQNQADQLANRFVEKITQLASN